MIADDENEIGEAAQRMSENYDFVVTRLVFESALKVPHTLVLMHIVVVALVQR